MNEVSAKPRRRGERDAHGGPAQEGPSLRSWLDELDAAGQLRRVRAKVDWEEEIGAIARANLAQAGPALLFERIADYETGRCTRFMTCGVGNKRQIELLLGLVPGTPDKAIVRHLKETFRKPIAPRIVKNGPVKENILAEERSHDGPKRERESRNTGALGTPDLGDAISRLLEHRRVVGI